jgi:predicted O-linked N-acetylglucosamine transferase (SPINDLY family)/glycosyltransferase involved in cell wall biosynthesis/predicted O-methyltransferase YrrM/ubiquinone/menaquinone biosynthesis C-methylase UbiE
METLKQKLVDLISHHQVKQRVYSILSRLSKDYYLKQDLENYSQTQFLPKSGFDSITFLNWYAHHFKPKHYLEVGVRRGRSMAQVLVESPQTKAYGFDLWIPNYASVPEQGIYTTNPGPEFVLSELNKIGVKNYPTLIQGNSHQTLPAFFANSNNPQEFDLIYIDGDHSYQGAKLDLDIAFAHLAPGGALIFDDICHPAHLYLQNLWNEYKILLKDYFFIEDLSKNGTAIAWKPPFEDLKQVIVDDRGDQTDLTFPKIIVDGVFFQITKTGIYQVWISLFKEWVNSGFSQHLIILDRAGTAPKIPGIQSRQIPAYDYNKTDADRRMLQQICDEEKADLFISTYYTTPLTTPSVFMAYDMIPERLGLDLNDPMWREKHYAIRQACAAISISENTARDLTHYFPQFYSDKITVAHCGTKPIFTPTSTEEIQNFKSKYGIAKPYFILVGERVGVGGYKNTTLFFQAFAQLANKFDREIICVGGSAELEPELKAYVPGGQVHQLRLSDEELKVAYSGAIALVYPSKYEGFGIPIVEAMACGCPVITCRKGAIPEVAGTAAIYVKDDDIEELVRALETVQKSEIRQSLISAGLTQSQGFSWSKMADIVSSSLVKQAQNLKQSDQKQNGKWQNFSYSKSSHFNQFSRFGYYAHLNPNQCDLKVYQDLLIYNLIIEHLPPGSKLLEIGGGNSRVIQALKQNYECWNLDKLEGGGNGPTQIEDRLGYRLIKDYIGNFNSELPSQYFDCVFSISTLEHIPEDESEYQKICEDIDRVLKPGGWSFHCFDIVIKPQEVWTNKFLTYLFNQIQTLQTLIPFEQMRQDSDLYVMSELAYNRYWKHITKKSYQEFGQPASYNIFWQKQSSPKTAYSPEIRVRQSLPKISIVTPSLNQAEFLEACIDSVLSQNYPNLEYIILDGGSVDGSVEIIKKYEKHLTYWQSQPDGGHYTAINAGFSRTTGDIMAWLNSDDKYHQDALFKVAAVFTEHQQVEWITGIPTEWNRQGEAIERQNYQLPWSRKLLLEKQNVRDNPQLQHLWIQQESTFWKRALWEKAGAKLQTNLQYAGDFELWLRFSRHAPLYRVQALIGGFRVYDRQRSNLYKQQYFQEVERVTTAELQLIQQGLYKTEIPTPEVIQLDEKSVIALKEEAKSAQSSVLNIAQNIKEEITIVTSIAPNNLEKQKTAIASWKSLGFSVVSLNTSSEIKQLQTLYENVTFHPVTRDAQAEVGKPLIYLDDILNFFKHQNSKICGIVNSDVQLKTDDKFYSWVLEQAKNAVVFGSRIEIESSNELQGEIYDKGFDFFFFNQQFLTAFPKTSFCLGLPWWDFLIPLIALQQGWTLKRLVTPIAYHVKHSVNYSNVNWQKYGILFVEFFNRELSSQLREQQKINPVQLQGNLIQIANQFLAEVQQKSIALEYQPFVIESDISHSSQQHNPLPSIEPQNLIIAEKNNKIFPSIEPLKTDLKRPLFSVMIPTFNKVKYLEEMLKSVLNQGFNSEEIQIEVINDCPDSAVQAELEAIVNKVGKERVKFYRHPEQNIGQTAIFNLCLQRAQGYWIHLLHDDDFVLPGFYQSLRSGIDQDANIGAAFCRHFYVDENSRQRSLSFLERETAGLLENWLEKIATSQRIQPSSIVVKRTTYERLGGFCKQAGSAADWEMWKRIAAYFPLWYEPQTLACYRLHSTSWTSRLLQTGGNILDTLKSIEMSQSYLPPEKAESLSKQAREHYAFYALNTAKQMLGVEDEKAAIAQIKAALKCSQSQQVKEAIIQLLSSDKLGDENLNLNEILTEATSLSEQYRQNSNNPTVIENLRKIRQTIAQLWLNTSLNELDSVYAEDGGKIHQTLLNSGMKNEPLTDTEQSTVNQWIAYLSNGLNQQNAIQHLLATMLYCYPHQLASQWYKNAPIPNWFVNDYLTFMLTSPQFFQERGEVERYYSYLQGWIDYLHTRIFSDKNSKNWQYIANIFLRRMNAIPLYFSFKNLKEIYIKRAEILEFALKTQGNTLDYTFPKRSENRDKIRLGILSNHFNPQTETYSTLPVFEHLDKHQFEIILYTCQVNNHPLEKYCQSRADRSIKLPQKLSDQVQTIRGDDLDILLIGTNVTAVTNSITLLALHRLARIQVTSTSSCVTTGMGNIDYYISGNLTESPQAPQQYREKLAVIEGTAHCFNYYAIAPEQPTVNPQRSDLKLDENTLVFISGANFYKIVPELRETWAKILAKVPNSVLILYPFNPNWTSSYARIPFLNRLKTAFEQYNVQPSRLLILDTQPSRTDIKQYLKLADVYLDSYPFSGVNSLVDPLEVGLVTVTQEGDSFRSRMGASLLRSLALDDLIAGSEDTYINLAVQLATNPQLREQYRQKIQQKMQQNPPFLDSFSYSKKMESLFKKLFNTWKQHQLFPEIPLNTPIARRDYLSELVHYINLYALHPSEQDVIERLRQLRKAMAEYWLKISLEQLEEVYKGHMGSGYQVLLSRGIQNEPLMEAERQFVDELTQVATGLKHPNSLNCLIAAMLYYVPGKMLVRDAEKRLPSWLIQDYKTVFENQQALQKVEKTLAAAQMKPTPETVTENISHLKTQQFQNRLQGCLNLYYIDPSNQSVVEELRQIRRQLADFWLTVAEAELEAVYQSSIGQCSRLFYKSEFLREPLTEAEQQIYQQLTTELNSRLNTQKFVNYVLAVRFYSPLEQLQIPELSALPSWLKAIN